MNAYAGSQESSVSQCDNPERSFYKEIVEQVKRMTHEERIQSLIEAGILTPDRKLSPNYGG